MDNQPKTVKGMHHVAMRVHDFNKSVTFYTEGMGFQKASEWGEGDNRSIMLNTGNGNFIEIYAAGSDAEKPEGAYLHIGYLTDNFDEALSRAVAAGAVITTDQLVTIDPTLVTSQKNPLPQKIRIAFCKGLDGEIFEFIQV